MALLHVNFPSKILNMEMEMDVILPETAVSQIGMKNSVEGKCKTLYLLHGMSDDHTIWQRRTSIERYAAQYNLIVVMPTVHLSWYTDMKNGDKYYTFVAKELPKICQSMFQQMSKEREDNFLAGLSMGGYGAVKIGLLEGQHFSHVASLSGAVDIVELMRSNHLKPSAYWIDIFGTLQETENSINNLFYLVDQQVRDNKQIPALFLWCGEEDFLFEHNNRFVAHLKNRGIEPKFTTSFGDHSWKYWDEQIQAVLHWLPLEGV